jgi:hypothetical protein
LGAAELDRSATERAEKSILMFCAKRIDRSPLLSYLKIDSYFDPLRSVPPFQDLLRRMNLQP